MTNDDKKTVTEESKILSIQDIAEADDLPVTPYEVPGWGGKLMMRGMTIRKRDTFWDDHKNEDGELDNVALTLTAVIMGVVEPKMTEVDIEMLEEKNPAILDGIVTEFLRLSGVDIDALIEARKNSLEGEAPDS